MSLQKGWIYNFRYARYRNDPQPLALILYADKRIAHAINISYLSPILANDLIDMLIMIATNKVSGRIIKGLDGEDTYELYHSYMKYKLGAIIKKAYRIYFIKSIRDLRPVSRGFNETTNYLSDMKTITAPIQKIIKEKIVKDIAFIQKDNKTILTPLQAEEWAIAYVSAAKEISKLKLDKSKYTGIKNFRDLEKER